MTTDGSSQRDSLEDFERRAVTVMKSRKQVFVRGTGPAVIVMCELPGITPDVARFARWVRDAGFTVYLPNPVRRRRRARRNHQDDQCRSPKSV